MSVDYVVVPNNLTMPPSFACRVQPKQVLDYQEIAEQINLHNPTIPAITARSVLEAFREEVMIQLLAGNTVKLTNFCSWVTTMPGKLVNATDPVPQNMINTTAKMSTTFKTELDQDASYNRVGYPTKDPSITEAKDTNTNIVAFIESGKGFKISGKNIGYTGTASDIGVFLKPGANAEVRQTNVSINDPSMIVITPSFTPEGDSDVEVRLICRNRYTSNGTLREGTYSRMLRTVVAVATGNDNELFNTATYSGVAEVTAWDGGTKRAEITAYLDTDNVVNIKAKEIDGEYGAVVQITGNGVYMIPLGLVEIQITVASLTNLSANLTAYARYINEIVDLTTLA